MRQAVGRHGGGNSLPVAARITSVVEGLTSRAAGTSWAAGDRIGITARKSDGTLLFNNKPYVTTDGDGIFAPEGVPFFFEDRDEVLFTAYYPFMAEAATQPEVGKVTDDQTPAGQARIDFLFAQAAGSSDRPEVQLSFRHCMSRIVFRFLAGDGIAALGDIEYTLQELYLEGLFDTQTGYCDTTNETAPITVSVPFHAEGMSSALLLFPQQSEAELTLSLTMRGKSYSAAFRLPENKENGGVRELAAGCSYSYDVVVNNRNLTVSPAGVAGWGDGGSENVESEIL